MTDYEETEEQEITTNEEDKQLIEVSEILSKIVVKSTNNPSKFVVRYPYIFGNFKLERKVFAYLAFFHFMTLEKEKALEEEASKKKRSYVS